MIHWPTFADNLVWCACDNRTFATAEEWQTHVVDSVNEERSRQRQRDETLSSASSFQPVDDSSGHAASSS